MTVIFLSDRPFANCSASGESCDAAVVVENFTTIANMYIVHVHVLYMCMKISDSCEVFHDRRGIARFTTSAAIGERTIRQKITVIFHSQPVREGHCFWHLLEVLGARRPNLKGAQPKWPWIVIFFEGHHGQFEGQRWPWPS